MTPRERDMKRLDVLEKLLDDGLRLAEEAGIKVPEHPHRDQIAKQNPAA